LAKNPKEKAVYRIIDANINRLKEGLRVCEEITRFVLNSHNLTSQFKKIRHRADKIIKFLPGHSEFYQQRKSSTDVGRKIYGNELKRTNYQDILFANAQRVKESLRVLEEFSKLISKKAALEFKDLRYEIYGLEKKIYKKILSCK
jgi:thiamine-phosphate pyrophosphorylase